MSDFHNDQDLDDFLKLEIETLAEVLTLQGRAWSAVSALVMEQDTGMVILGIKFNFQGLPKPLQISILDQLVAAWKERRDALEN